MSKARVIAFYLPQYYPIPENDEVWGKGFTEWTNVAKAKPLFRGHYQPRIPADLGFYDLRVPEIREQQAQMALDAGVEGFVYWHYWFGNGKRLLERPFEEVLATGKPDFPFCLAWANHSWTTKTWTTMGHIQSDKMIVEQLYPGEQDYTNHFYNVLPAFRDKRYITVDGKPLFLLYAPIALPDASQFIGLWNKLAVENGLKGVHFVGLASGTLDHFQPILDAGYDAIAPSYLWYAEAKLAGNLKKKILRTIREKWDMVSLDKYDYKNIIKHLTTDWDLLENVYPSIIPQWDRSPRSGRRAVIYHGSTPELFRKHMENILEKVDGKTDEHKIIFLRSWNEWGEGNYVEPDLKYGTAYLDAVKEVFSK